MHTISFVLSKPELSMHLIPLYSFKCIEIQTHPKTIKNKHLLPLLLIILCMFLKINLKLNFLTFRPISFVTCLNARVDDMLFQLNNL